jgi:ubiquinone/menaquinone biosynthesis C-methylase UbiE
MSDKKLTYEESVCLLRDQQEQAATIRDSYLDRDNFAAAQRFQRSEEFAAMVDLLQLDRPNRSLKILDLGCGNGIVSYAFAALGHEVYSVDPDTSDDVGLEAAARLAAQPLSGRISTFQAFAESLPFPDHTFDVVYTRQALHHFGDLPQGLAECARVLKPQGKFLATREHVADNEQQLKVFLETHVMHKLHGGENAYPLKVYLTALQQSGLKVSKCLAPFDTVINHFPTSNLEIENQLIRSLSKVSGLLAPALGSLPFVKKLYRSHLSRACTYPGRLYSFLCIKG